MFIVKLTCREETVFGEIPADVLESWCEYINANTSVEHRNTDPWFEYSDWFVREEPDPEPVQLPDPSQLTLF